MTGRPGHKRRRRTGGPWVYLVGIVFVFIGAVTTLPGGPSEAELHQQEECAGVRWHAGMDQEGWDLLKASGYVERGGRLRPPGCEGVR